MAEKKEDKTDYSNSALSEDEISQLIGALGPSKTQEEAAEPPDNNTLTITNNLDTTVKHDGDVLIEGMMLPGSRIEASGYITVTGGIIGAVIISAIGVSTPFAEMSRIISEGDLMATSHLLNCEVHCGEGIYCASNTGSIIRGGKYHAYETIQADIFGSPLEVQTELRLVKSDPLLKTIFKLKESGDVYYRKIAATQKVYPNTNFAIYDYFYSNRKMMDEPFILDISMLGGE
jgi:Flagellar Assembly Protein A beta solenoid domain